MTAESGGWSWMSFGQLSEKRKYGLREKGAAVKR